MKGIVVISILIVLSVFSFWAEPLEAAMSGTIYSIYADTFSFVDNGTVSGDTFAITGTGGELAPSSTVGDTFDLRGGFQAAGNGILSFMVSPSSISLGAISPSAVSTADVTLTISTDSQTGYTITASADGDLRSGTNVISRVTDGSVTAGQTEYGINISGLDALQSGDVGLNGTVQVASKLGAVTNRQTTVAFRASVAQGAAPATYSQIVTFTATVNP